MEAVSQRQEIIYSEYFAQRKLSLPCLTLASLIALIIGFLPIIPSKVTLVFRPIFIGISILFIQKFTYPQTKTSKALFLYMGYMGVIWLAHDITLKTTLDYFSMPLFALFFYFATQRIWNKKEIKFILNTVILAALFCAVVLLVKNEDLRRMNGEAELRFFSGIMNRNPLAFAMAPGAVTACLLMVHGNKRVPLFALLLYGGALVIIGYTVLATGARSASLSMLIALFLVIWEKARDIPTLRGRAARKIFVIAISFLAIFLMMRLTDGTSSARIFDNLDDNNGREELWEFAWTLIHEKPVFGGGFGYWERMGGSGLYTHNSYLMIMVISGYTGAILLTIFLVTAALELWSVRNYAILAFLPQVVFHIYTETTLDYSAYIPLSLAFILFQATRYNNRSLLRVLSG